MQLNKINLEAFEKTEKKLEEKHKQELDPVP